MAKTKTSELKDESPKPQKDPLSVIELEKPAAGTFESDMIEGAIAKVPEERLAAIAHDKAETWGRRMKLVTEAGTQTRKGFRISVEEIELHESKTYYTFAVKDHETGMRGTGSFSVEESEFLETRPKALGVWLRRLVNAAVRRKLNS